MLVVGQSVQFLDLLNLSLFGHDAEAPTQYARTLLLPLGELLVTLGLVGLYVRQAGEAGIVGLVGFVLAFLGVELIRGNYLAVLLANLGLALFGVGSLRAGIYPRTASVLLIVSALVREAFSPTVDVGPGARFGYVGAGAAVVLFVAIAWMGFVLLTRRGEGVEEAQTSPRPSTTSPNLLWLGGLATVVGAALVVLFDLTQLVNLYRPDPGASTSGLDQAEITIMYVQQLLALLGEALVGLGLVALYVRLSEVIPRESGGARGMQLLTLVGFLVAFGGTYFALDVEDVNWAAVLVAHLGWVLFGTACLRASRTSLVYPRLALVLLIITALIAGVFLNPLIVNQALGEDTASSILYVGQGDYPLAYVSTGSDIAFNLVVAWLGFTLLREARREARASTRRARSRRDTGGTSFRYSSPKISLITGVVLLAGLLQVALITGILPGGKPPGLDVAQAQSTETDPSCPSANQATYGAYHSNRLVLHDSCQHLVATVQKVKGGEYDGDLDIYVNVDPEYASLTGAPQNIDNLRRYSNGGNLLIELMPRDAPHIPSPEPGDKVDVYGAYVFDSQHGFYEIHPIFKMAASSDGGVSWGDTYTSGPQYGGPPRRAYASQAFTQCRDQKGKRCKGYYDPNKP
jgi:hypothetical protein